ncbi:hypothetical protein [Streptomyces sp. CA-111067]|uniref:hypothetical protein n=1 Tax=Streptomyces sp. CA-111067 TaxID=3240046 RepID=UPI003D966909
MSLPPVEAISANVEKGKNLAEAANWVRAQNPDIFFLQELQPGQGEIVTELTGMTGYIAAPTAQSSNDNAIFLREGGPLVFDEEFSHPWAPWHAPANIAVRFRDQDGTLSPRRIALVSAHLCYWSPQTRLAEAQWMSTLSKAGWLAMVFADWNSYRQGEGGPWEGYQDAAFVANRTYLTSDGRRLTDDRPDRELTAAGFDEMARHAADHLGQRDAMRPTSGYRDHPGRPTGLPAYTIDRGYHTSELTPALESFEVCDTPELREYSDHLPQRATYNATALREILHRPTRVYEPNTVTPGALTAGRKTS